MGVHTCKHGCKSKQKGNTGNNHQKLLRPHRLLSFSYTMNVITVCGPNLAKFATQPLKNPIGPSVLRMSAAQAIVPLYLLPP